MRNNKKTQSTGILQSVSQRVNNVFYTLGIKKKPVKKVKIGKLAFLKGATGVIHIGANRGQERNTYNALDVMVLWVEAIPSMFKTLQKNIAQYPKQVAFNALMTDKKGKEYDFKVANNNGSSSSILDLHEHKKIWPQVHYEKTIKLISNTLPSLIEENKIDLNNYQALILDTQGSELLILQGAQKILNKFEYIFTEIADFEAYKDCCLLPEMEEFMRNNGFVEYKRFPLASREGIGNYFNILYKKA